MSKRVQDLINSRISRKHHSLYQVKLKEEELSEIRMGKEISYSIDDALEKAKFGKFNYFMIVLFALILVSGFLEVNSVNMILSIAQCELDLSNSHKGFLGAVGYIGIIVSSHFWGFMADTRGRKKVLIPALIYSFLFTVISSFSTSFWFLAVTRFFNGFCVCATQTIVYAYLCEFYSLKLRDLILLVASVIYAIFTLIYPLYGILFLSHESWNFYIPFLDMNYRSWRLFILMCGVPSVLSVIGMIVFIPESPKFTYAQGDEEGTLKILQRIFKCNTGKPADEYEVKSLIKDQESTNQNPAMSKGFFSLMWSQTIQLFKRPHLKNTLTACYLQFGVCLSSNGFWTFLPETLNRVSLWMESEATKPANPTLCHIVNNFDRSSNSSISEEEHEAFCVTKLELGTFTNVVILLIFYILSLFTLSLLIKRVGKVLIISTINIIGGAASLLLMFTSIPYLSIAIYFMMLLSIVNLSVINASTVELFPTSLRAMAVSLSMMIGRIGSVLGSNFLGLLIKNYCTYTWLLPAVLLFSGGFLAFTIPNVKKLPK
ncbi:synaptic vesicle glycoprotein 2B-like [Chironomus tepperi]|uniref:synaptic vesicle glycoprotein 2B-like n=1 Tax=Chironomus tepperi TaxID=113505 RepID=UPI00391F8052